MIGGKTQKARKSRSNKGSKRGPYGQRKRHSMKKSNNVFPSMMKLPTPNNQEVPMIRPLYTTYRPKPNSLPKYKELTPQNFMAKVRTPKKQNKMLAVAFYAPWCGHCNQLMPEWSKAASQLKKHNIELGAIDSSKSDPVTKSLNHKYGVQGFPTIKVFKPRCGGQSSNYNGGRTASDIVSTLKTMNHKPKTPRVHNMMRKTPSFINIMRKMSNKSRLNIPSIRMV